MIFIQVISRTATVIPSRCFGLHRPPSYQRFRCTFTGLIHFLLMWPDLGHTWDLAANQEKPGHRTRVCTWVGVYSACGCGQCRTWGCGPGQILGTYFGTWATLTPPTERRRTVAEQPSGAPSGGGRSRAFRRRSAACDDGRGAGIATCTTRKPHSTMFSDRLLRSVLCPLHGLEVVARDARLLLLRGR